MHTVGIQSEDPSEPGYVVAVRALCEFTAKRGDLDLRFTPSPSAQEGIAGHAVVTARRPAGYLKEITLADVYGPLRIRGRADGYDPAANRLEEIKTYRGRLDAMPGNHRHLHWAQARVYGWLLCQKLGLAELRVALVYFDIASQTETVLVETHSADALRAHFVDQCERFIAWAGQEVLHRHTRDTALTALAFPHASFRPGQRELAAAVYRAARGATLPDGAGADGHRQDHRHALSAAESVARPATRQDPLPHRQERRAATRARCTRHARRLRAADAAARARTGRARQGLRASRSRVPRRFVSARARLLRSLARRAGGRAPCRAPRQGRACAQSRSRTRSARIT